jgi:chaperonin GroES
MTTLAIALMALLSVNGAQSFSPTPFVVRQVPASTSRLYENLLEGRKIAGEVQPLSNFVLVKTVGKKEATDEGILLAGSSKIVKTQGTVVAVGPGRTHEDTGRLIEIPLQQGEGVIYGEYDGTEIDLNGQPHMLIRDNDVLVKYTEDKLTLDSVDVIRNSILVQIDDDEQATAGGVLLASNSATEKRPSTGTVVKVGPGKMAGDGSVLPMPVSIGDKVKFMDFAGNEVEIEGEEYSVVKSEEILATF